MNTNLEQQIAEEKRRILVFFQNNDWFTGRSTPLQERMAEGLANHLVRNRVQVEQGTRQLLVEALKQIARMKGMTLLGRRWPTGAHEEGANKAFEQAAHIAEAALAAEKDA